MAISGREVWRDFVTDGVPSSGDHNPKKSDARAWSENVDDRLEQAGQSILAFGDVLDEALDKANDRISRIEEVAEEGVIVATTLSVLNSRAAALGLGPSSAGRAGRVYNDSTPSNNGDYEWTGAAWSILGLDRTGRLEAHASKYVAFSFPIIWDRDGIFGAPRTVYISRYFTARLGGSVLSSGPYNAASSFDTNYASFTLASDLTHVLYMDFADTANPIKVVVGSSAVPTSARPNQILIFGTIRQRMVHSDVPVIETNDQLSDRVFFQRALVVDNGKILIPSFYHFSRATGFTYYSPTSSHPATGERYWEFPISTSFINETRIYFNRHAPAGVAPVQAVSSSDIPTYPGGAGIVLIASTLRGYVHSEFALAGDVPGGRLPNLFSNALDARNAVMFSSESMPMLVTDADMTDIGVVAGVSGTSSYYGEELPFDTPKRGFYFARVYVVSSEDDDPSTPRFFLFDSSQTITLTADMVLEKIISTRVRMYTIEAPYNLASPPVSFTIGLSQEASALTVCGAQVYVGPAMTGAILRDDYSQPISPEPLYGRRHFAIAGREVPIIGASLLAERDRPEDITISFWRDPVTDADKPWHATAKHEGVTIDTPGEFKIMSMTTRGSRVKRRLSRSVSDVRVSSVAAETVRILGVGDSITNRNTLTLLQNKLIALGVTPEFIGTINNREFVSEPLVVGEGRGGWRAADFYHQFTTYPAISSTASYLALNPENAASGGRWGYNPFIRDATGSDAAENTFNGKVFDFGFYLERFGYADPDFVPIGLGTNDINTHSSAASLSYITNAMRIMVPSIRAACPNAHIAWWLPNVPRAAASDRKWREEYVPAIRAMLAYELELADPKFSILSTWAHMDTVAGWTGSNENSIAPDAGLTVSAVTDELHPIGFNRHMIAEVLTAWVCAAS